MKIFVYGTLQRGMYNNSTIDREFIEKIEPATIKGRLFMVEKATFPAVIIPESKKDCYEIKGELFFIKDEFADKALTVCDILEGHPVFYKRRKITAKTSNSDAHSAFVYVMTHKRYLGLEINDGDYKKFYNEYINPIRSIWQNKYI